MELGDCSTDTEASIYNKKMGSSMNLEDESQEAVTPGFFLSWDGLDIEQQIFPNSPKLQHNLDIRDDFSQYNNSNYQQLKQLEYYNHQQLFRIKQQTLLPSNNISQFATPSQQSFSSQYQHLSPYQFSNKQEGSSQSQSKEQQLLSQQFKVKEVEPQNQEPYLVLEDENQSETYESSFQSGQAADLLKRVLARRRKKIQKQPQTTRFYNKNICRYIIDKALALLQENNPHRDSIQQICQRYNVDVDEFCNYYLRLGTGMMGPKLLKYHIQIKMSDTLEVIKRKQSFQEFLKWYLDNLASRHILQSKQKKDMKEYFSYKNFVMLYFISIPGGGHVGNEQPKWN